MQTVQAAFRQADTEELVDAYLTEYPLRMDDFTDEVTIGEAKAFTRIKLRDYLERLRTLPIKAATEGEHLFYAYHRPKEGIAEPTFALVLLTELRQKGIRAADYAFEFTDQSEIMGYYIADNRLTKHYLTELWVYIMYEASFFGFEQEDLQENLVDLKTRVQEAKDWSAAKPAETKQDLDWLEKLVKEAGIIGFSPEEKAYLDKVIDYEGKIIEHSQQTEVEEILNKLG